MEKLVLVGGQAGQGSDRTSLLIAQALTGLGFYVFNYRDYPSLIKGGHNFNVLKISDQPVFSHEKKVDVIIAFDQKTIDLHRKELKNGGLTLGDQSLKATNLIAIDVQTVVKKLQTRPVVGNNALIGALLKIFGLPLAALEKVFQKEFGAKAPLLTQAAQEGYRAVKTQAKLTAVGKSKYFFSGSEAVASGALAAGLDTYFAYPMTPATPLLHLLAAQQEKEKISVWQLENEIAVINAALGASFAGAMAMVGTSGGGFALMSEAMSLSGMAEIPLVVYLAQRTAPATGVPTYTGQGDLKFAVNVGHGEFPRVVVAPGDPQEVFQRTIEAFYLSYKYQLLTILLSDKHLAESGFTFDQVSQPRVKAARFLVDQPKADYKRYLPSEDGVSPRAVPGQGPVVRATSYEHDEAGQTVEDAVWPVKMNDKRWRKLAFLEKEIGQLEPVKIYGQGKKLIIGWGSTKGAILDALKNLPGYRFLQVSYIRPFPSQKVKREIEAAGEVVLIENNVTGLLGQIIAEKTGLFVKEKLLKYDARPFTSAEVVRGVKGLAK